MVKLCTATEDDSLRKKGMGLRTKYNSLSMSLKRRYNGRTGKPKDTQRERERVIERETGEAKGAFR